MIAQTVHGRFQQRGNVLPNGGFGCVRGGLHKGLLLAEGAAALHFQGVGGQVAGGPVEPAGQDGIGFEAGGLAGQQNENGLGDLFRQLRLADAAQRG